jgi:hypothetical protein
VALESLRGIGFQPVCLFLLALTSWKLIPHAASKGVDSLILIIGSFLRPAATRNSCKGFAGPHRGCCCTRATYNQAAGKRLHRSSVLDPPFFALYFWTDGPRIECVACNGGFTKLGAKPELLDVKPDGTFALRVPLFAGDGSCSDGGENDSVAGSSKNRWNFRETVMV